MPWLGIPVQSNNLQIIFAPSPLSASSGSGTVIAVRNKKSLILTAEHVCKTSFYKNRVVFKKKYIVITSKKYVITAKGKKLRVTKIIKKNSSSDICVMEVDGIAGRVVRFAHRYPPKGSYVISVGAPQGYWHNGLPNVVGGWYIGIRTETIRIGFFEFFKNFSQYSLPIIGGQSGSAVF